MLHITGVHLKIIFILLCMILSHRHHVNGRDDLVYTTSFLDGDQMRTFYRTFRDLAMRIVGQTGRRTRGPFLQETENKFPCNVTGMRSETVPTSVHRLRPGTRTVAPQIYANQRQTTQIKIHFHFVRD